MTRKILSQQRCLIFPENIALNKPAWQRSQFKPGDSRFHASNAVDGRKSDLVYLGGQCAISDNSQRTATWRVDLGDILSIRHITIYFRTDNNPWGLCSRHIKFTHYAYMQYWLLD
jgi:hypothetical protein